MAGWGSKWGSDWGGGEGGGLSVDYDVKVIAEIDSVPYEKVRTGYITVNQPTGVYGESSMDLQWGGEVNGRAPDVIIYDVQVTATNDDGEDTKTKTSEVRVLQPTAAADLDLTVGFETDGYPTVYGESSMDLVAGFDTQGTTGVKGSASLDLRIDFKTSVPGGDEHSVAPERDLDMFADPPVVHY